MRPQGAFEDLSQIAFSLRQTVMQRALQYTAASAAALVVAKCRMWKPHSVTYRGRGWEIFLTNVNHEHHGHPAQPLSFLLKPPFKSTFLAAHFKSKASFHWYQKPILSNFLNPDPNFQSIFSLISYLCHPTQNFTHMLGRISNTTLRILSERGVPPPFTDFFWQKRSYGFGGYPPPPFTNFSPKNVLQKGLKIVFFAQKHLILVQKIGYGFGGYPLPPLYGFFF